MPIEPSYRKHLDSMIADLKNWSAKPGGGITAALFLQEFISTDKVPLANTMTQMPASHAAGGDTPVTSCRLHEARLALCRSLGRT